MLTITVRSEYFQPYHLFEPFLDISLPIAFEAEEREAELAVRILSSVI